MMSTKPQPAALSTAYPSRRSIAGGVGLVLVAVVLMIPLAHTGHLDAARLADLTLSARPGPLLAVLVCLALSTWLSAVKWRLTSATDGGTAYALTALGVALGQVLPLNFATGLARTIGARVTGDLGMLRAAGTTAYEQIFDIATVVVLAAAAGVTWLVGGDATAWAMLAVVASAIGWGLTGSLTARLSRWAGGCSDPGENRGASQGVVRRLVAAIHASGCIEPGLARRLYLLSVVRFVLLVGMCHASARAVGLEIAPWQLGAALPFTILAMAVAPLPGGLGVFEWSLSGALVLFGVPVETAVHWVVINRLLAIGASVLVGLSGCAVLLARTRARKGWGRAAVQAEAFDEALGVSRPS